MILLFYKFRIKILLPMVSDFWIC